MPVKQVTSTAEFKKLVGAQKLTVVDFFAVWCGPCKAVAPVVEQMSNSPAYRDVQFLKVDVDQLNDVAAEHNVTAMPTFQLFKSGKKVDEVVGADMNSLERKVKQHNGSGTGGASASSGGYVLGTGKKIGSQQTAGTSAAGGNFNIFWAVIAVFLLYVWWQRRAGGGQTNTDL